MKRSIFLTKNIIFLVTIFLPIFVSLEKNNYFLTFSRTPELQGYLFTFPISVGLIIICSLYYYKQLKFNLIQFSLLIISIYVTCLGVTYDRSVYFVHGIAITIFILANNFFRYYFHYLINYKNKDLFNQSFNYAIFIFMIILIYAFLLMGFFTGTNPKYIYLINENIIIFNWTNFFSNSLLLILAFLISYKKINYFLIFLYFIIVSTATYFSTSTISVLILVIWFLTFFINGHTTRKLIFKNYIYIFATVTVFIAMIAILIDFSNFPTHNIRFRFMTWQFYFQNINLYELIIPISSPYNFNYSAHNQTFSFLIYGGVILVFLFYKNLKNLIDEIPDSMKEFKFLLILFLVFGTQVQNYFTNPYMAIIIAFFINYSIYLKKQN